MDLPLDELIKAALAKVEAMTPEERREMYRRQAEGWARSEASWPAPKYAWINGVKVYESYEDYCAD